MGNKHLKASVLNDDETKFRKITNRIEHITGHKDYYSRYYEHMPKILEMFTNGNLTNDDDNLVIYEIMGLYYSYVGDENEDLKYGWSLFASALGENFSNSNALINIGDYYMRIDKKDEAFLYYKKVHDMGIITGTERLGYWYFLTGDFDKAIEYYEEAISAGSTCIFHHYGCLKYKQAQYKKAIELFIKACEHDKSSKNFNILGHCLLDKNNPCLALKYFYEAYMIDMSKAELFECEIGLCFEKMMEMNCFNNIIEKNPVVLVKTDFELTTRNIQNVKKLVEDININGYGDIHV